MWLPLQSCDAWSTIIEMGRVMVTLLVGVIACGGSDGERRELVNVGEVCLRLQPTGMVQVTVTFPGCLNSCDIAQPTSCSVTKADEEGQAVLSVESFGAVQTTGAKVCSAACGRLTADCASVESFAPGTYTVRHGADEASLSLGSQQQCLFTGG